MLELSDLPNSTWPTLYRGQCDSTWKLIPQLFRLNTDFESLGDHSKWEGLEELLMEKFKKQSLPILKNKPQGWMDWLTIAQHHGVPTRLLDWTTNSLVALFFAVENSFYEENDAKLFKLIFSQYTKTDFLNENGPMFEAKNSVIFPNHSSRRVNAQQGCFSVHELPLKNDDFVPLSDGEHEREFKIESYIIPAKYKFSLKVELDKFGMNYFNLFPDLDGLSKSLKWEVERHYRIDSK